MIILFVVGCITGHTANDSWLFIEIFGCFEQPEMPYFETSTAMFNLL